MKYIAIRFLVYILILFLAFSCKTDEKDWGNPSIQVLFENGQKAHDTILAISDTLVVTVNAVSNGTDKLTLYNYSVNTESGINSVDSGINTNQFTSHKVIVKGISENETWSFMAKDFKGHQKLVSFSIQKDTSSIFGNIIHFSSVTLSAQNANPALSFYLLKNNQVYTLAGASAIYSDIDLAYYFDNITGDENTIASPGANIDTSIYTGAYALQNWTYRKTTRFIQAIVSAQEFNICNNDSLILATTFEFSTGKRKAKNLTVGDIYSFVTEDGKKGLFKVKNVAGTDAGTVEIEIKLQK